MVRTDPYRPGNGVYECIKCGRRASNAGRCPNCGNDLQNISVPRE